MLGSVPRTFSLLIS